jgi:HEPN domain-containing protein
MRPPEQIKREILQNWLTKAGQDIEVAQYLVSGEASCFNAVGFHSQQAAEKYLKALLVWHQVEFTRTHDLDELLDLVATIDANVSEPLRDCIGLTDYGVDIRYPGDTVELTFERAKQAVALAVKVCDAVLAALPEDVRNA